MTAYVTKSFDPKIPPFACYFTLDASQTARSETSIVAAVGLVSQQVRYALCPVKVNEPCVPLPFKAAAFSPHTSTGVEPWNNCGQRFPGTRKSNEPSVKPP